MPPTAAGIKEFLNKRGFEVQVVELTPGSFNVIAENPIIPQIVTILGSIADGSRFLVTINHDEVIKILDDRDHLKERIEKLENRKPWYKFWSK